MLLLPSSSSPTEKDKARAIIHWTKAAIFDWKSSSSYGQPPPTFLRDAGYVAPNNLNEGIEVLVETFAAPDSRVNPFGDERGFINNDQGNTSRRKSDGTPIGLHEFADPWGNPLVHMRLQDFGSSRCTAVKYVTKAGTTIEVTPRRAADSNEFEYQIVSLGPGSIYGTGDDIVSWDLLRD